MSEPTFREILYELTTASVSLRTLKKSDPGYCERIYRGFIEQIANTIFLIVARCQSEHELVKMDQEVGNVIVVMTKLFGKHAEQIDDDIQTCCEAIPIDDFEMAQELKAQNRLH